MYILKNKIFFLYSLLGLFFSITTLNAQNNKQEIVNYAAQFLTDFSNEIRVPKECFIIDDSKENKNYLVRFTKEGFVILTKQKSNLSVLAFSDENEFLLEDNPFLKNRKGKIVKIPFVVTNLNTKLQATKDTSKGVNSEIIPFLTDTWGGVNCKNASGGNVFPSNYYTPNHCSPGCVAIAPSQILHYYEWPIIGVGNNVFSDNYNGNQIRHKAFFDQNNYDWGNMLDEYMGVNSTVEEQQAVGELMYDMGVAILMDYEPSGSTNNLDNVPFALENFFRFSGHYKDKLWSEFWTRLYDSMQLQRPVPIAVKNTNTGSGHVMVANGYKYLNNKNYYYINWGWWNTYGLNGYYDLQGWNSGTSGYNEITGAIFDMLPEPQITLIEPNGNDDDFVVTWKISNKLNWEEFTLQQKVDGGVWEDLAIGITEKNYTITSPTGTVYQFRVKAKVDGFYYTGSYSEIEVYSVENWYNGFANFEGSQYAYARQTPDYDLDFSGDYTFETWLRLQNDNQDNDVIFDQKDVFGFTIHEVNSNDYSVRFNSHTSNQTISSNQSGSKLQTGQWYHIAVSKIGNLTKLYVNGVERVSYTGSGLNLATANNALNIGEKYHGSYSSWIKANFDQMRISSIGRYTTSFTPTRDHHFATDPETIAYFTFQNVHRVRFKDEAYNISVIVNNANNYITWDFEESIGSLTMEEQIVFNQHVRVYPNPTKGSIVINIEKNNYFDNTSFSFQLYDINGKKIEITIKNNSIDISDLDSGIYILKLISKDLIATKRIIKQ